MITRKKVFLYLQFLSFSWSTVSCLKLSNSCGKECVAESDKLFRYSIQEEECHYDMSATRGVPTNNAKFESIIGKNNESYTLNLKVRYGSSSFAQIVRGFKIDLLVVNPSIYTDMNASMSWYICFHKGFYVKDSKTINKNIKFLISFTDINPGDDLAVTAYTVPRKSSISTPRPWLHNKGYHDFIGYTEKTLLLFKNCSHEKSSGINHCRVEKKLKVSVNSTNCNDGKYIVETVVPKELQKYEPYIQVLNHEKGLVFRKNLNLNNSNGFHEFPTKGYSFNKLYSVDLYLSNRKFKSDSFILPNDCNNLSLLVIILPVVVFVLLSSFITIFWLKRNITSVKSFGFNDKNQQVFETKVETKDLGIYLGYSDSRVVFKSVVNSFATILHQNLGISVNFSSWTPEAEIQSSSWMERMLTDCDKFIIVWSLDSVKTFASIGESSLLDFSNDLFFGFAVQLKQSLLRNFIEKSKIVSVYFDKRCEDKIPEWFCKLVDKHFYLMEQFEELYAYLKDHTKYYPHSKLITELSALDDSIKDKVSLLRSYNDSLESTSCQKDLTLADISNNSLHIQPPSSEGPAGEAMTGLNVIPPEDILINDNCGLHITPPSVPDQVAGSKFVVLPPIFEKETDNSLSIVPPSMENEVEDSLHIVSPSFEVAFDHTGANIGNSFVDNKRSGIIPPMFLQDETCNSLLATPPCLHNC